MDLQHVLYEKRDAVAYVTVNRPEVMNALHPPARAELEQVWEDFAADDSLWVAILTGAGERAFCAGSDLKYRVTEADQQALRGPAGQPNRALERCLKPVIAAVNGYAVGGGLELALSCDIIIAAEHAQFGLPEPRRGLMADEGGVVKLPRRLPYHMAMGMVLTGRFFTAAEAHAMGLVNEVVQREELMAAAGRWAAEITKCSSLALQAAKQVVVSTIDLSPEAAGARMEQLSAVQRLRHSADYVEGPRAFAEKRPPRWQGR